MEELHDLVYCLAASPNFKKDGLIFVAKQSGLYRSTDGGKTWKDAYAILKLNASLPTTFVALATAGKTTYVFACAEGKVLRSLDVGKTWEAADLESPAPQVTALVASPDFAQDGTILAATVQDGIFRSIDRGVSWADCNFGLYDPNINALSFIDAQTFVCGTQSGVFISANAGQSWRDLDFPMNCAPVLSLAVSVDKAIYAGMQDAGLWRSRDKGKTWEQVNAGAVEHILIDPNGKILIVRDGELLLSKDGGKTWRVRAGLETDSAISSLIAPLGLDRGDPILIGLSNGEIVTL